MSSPWNELPGRYFRLQGFVTEQSSVSQGIPASAVNASMLGLAPSSPPPTPRLRASTAAATYRLVRFMVVSFLWGPGMSPRPDKHDSDGTAPPPHQANAYI